ncbi:neutral alpha-glucosidase AB-like isoform X2 [Oscarella lobularis]|uniref:neutral alpha-glucosidase AB-like isoform X2 n=1 Tax=Oscarella lobularis TaxID=121494 RepID=UPI0033142466
MLPFVRVLLLLCISEVLLVDESNFKKCDQSGFCRRQRKIGPRTSPYVAIPNSIEIRSNSILIDVRNTRNDVVFVVEFNAIEDSTSRLRIREKNPLRPRYEVDGALVGEPKLQNLNIASKGDGGFVAAFEDKRVAVAYKPFRVDFQVGGITLVTFNGQGLLEFEHYREKKEAKVEEVKEENGEEEEEKQADDEEGHKEENEEIKRSLQEELEKETDDNGNEQKKEEEEEEEEEERDLWEESFRSHHDSKVHGPSSIGVDIAFPGSSHVYGIPEHADSLNLKETTNEGDPYRLYNLDVFEYELNKRMALYGSIPFLMSHTARRSVGMFWHNAAETWIDISRSANNNNADSQGDVESQRDGDSGGGVQTSTHWISESGIIDLFVFFGPKPADVLRQYSALTGRSPIPPMFSLGYHQCRWNYNDQDDVESVNQGYENMNCPLDVIWLDIEHTDSKKYFTWDGQRFPDSVKMLNHISSYGRKMVTIVDPHVKREGGYRIHEEAQSRGYYIKNSAGDGDYEGSCWPGSSSWPDFLNPEVRDWYSSKFQLSEYEGSTPALFTWNDMNEPSVFNGPEITMHKDAKHHGGWEHRDVHNIYGMLHLQATAEGLVRRSNGRLRPFVLSRAFFAGSQRYGAIWTGDNLAHFDHLAASVPMLLSVGIAGLPFVGADVGGFFKDPDEELLRRWYQAGAYQPFFRGHAHLDTRRREPWLFSKDTQKVMREAIVARYALLPYLYTLFYVSSQNGSPVMRPLWFEFPEDTETFGIDDEYLIGRDMLVKPVQSAGTEYLSIYLPGSGVWYDQDDYKKYSGGERITLSTSMTKIPVFLRGGGIVAKKLRIRRSSTQMIHDPYTLYVSLDNEGKAAGLLYVDDGQSFDYRDGKYLLRSFEFKDKTFTSTCAVGHQSSSYETSSYIERVIIIGLANAPTSVRLSASPVGEPLNFLYNANAQTLVIKKPGVNVASDFKLTLN